MDCIVLDFETYPIAMRPHYPPVPVGLATKWPGRAPQYLAFGHVAGGNNASEEDAVAELRRIWESGLPILCHNAKFDVDVACARYGLPMLPWDRIEDTLYLAFLHDPHSRNLQLKALAEQLCDMPPDERDQMVWYCQSRDPLDLRHAWFRNFGTESRKFTPSRIGEWIWLVPGDVVGPYAIGDLTRTEALFNGPYAAVRERLREPYDRERQLMPILLRNEQAGLRVDLERMLTDIAVFDAGLEVSEAWLRRRLNAADLNLDADWDVADALSSNGIVTEWSMTAPTKAHPEGLRSMSKETLTKARYHDPRVFEMLGYRNRLSTALGTFMKPWALQAAENGSRISTTWNQVRGADNGTRTGRPSCNRHNFLNLPKSFEGRASDGWTHPTWFAEDCGVELPRLPVCRDYVLPDDGHVWLHRDFSGQELRVFAHFESGDLLRAYIANPDLDPHTWVKDMIREQTGKELERTRVKNVTFSRLYGGGLPAVRWQAQCATDAEARELMALHDGALPGRRILNDEIVRCARLNIPIVTWGGREYLSEKLPGRDLSYKVINYEVQGSSADITKQALIEWGAQSMPWERFLVTVYDEINISAPIDCARDAMLRLERTMDAPRIDCPMRSEGKVGHTWGSLVKEKDWTWA